jgi:cystathionine beta-lyase/cystathionine gamma-synthase
LECAVAALEGGADALAFSSGMAAVSCLMELFRPGDHIIASDDLYGGTHRLFSHVSEKNGLTFSFAATPETIARSVRPETRAIIIETPTNPMLQVMDIEETAAVARRHNLLLIVDNTFLTPYFQNPLELGADVVLHSGTKFLGGHNDTLAGFLVLRDLSLAEHLRFLHKTIGACLSPFDSFLIARGIKTLALRMERGQSSALEIARHLEHHDLVERVYYPGLPDHEGHALMRQKARGFGAVLSFSVRDEAIAAHILGRVRVIQYAESLGGAETLITHPVTQTPADVPEQERLARGITPRLLRLSVGLESPQDLIADLTQSLRPA